MLPEMLPVLWYRLWGAMGVARSSRTVRASTRRATATRTGCALAQSALSETATAARRGTPPTSRTAPSRTATSRWRGSGLTTLRAGRARVRGSGSEAVRTRPPELETPADAEKGWVPGDPVAPGVCRWGDSKHRQMGAGTCGARRRRGLGGSLELRGGGGGLLLRQRLLNGAHLVQLLRDLAELVLPMRGLGGGGGRRGGGGGGGWRSLEPYREASPHSATRRR